MPTPLFHINAKEFYKGIFDTMGMILWAFKWPLLVVLGVAIFMAFLPRFLENKIFRIFFITAFILAIAAFFIWIYY